MWKKTLLVTILLFLVACQANQSAFSPDISTTVRPQSSDPVNVNDEDIKSVKETTLEELSSGGEEIIRFTKGETLTNFCSDQENTISASASPSVKDLNPADNDASQRITC